MRPMHEGRGRWAFGLGAAGLLLLSLLVSAIFYPLTLTALAKFLIFSERPAPADLIVILGGDFWGPRALAGAKLGAEGYAKHVLISGPPYNDRPESELSIRFLVEKGFRRDLFISFPNMTRSTVEEAIAVCPELHRLAARNVLLVTSEYHSRRANLVFRLFCPDVRFRSFAALDTQFEAENWWRNGRYRRVFYTEWEKIFGTIFWEYPQRRLTLLWHAVQPG